MSDGEIPIDPFAKVEAFGMPWHGAVKSGQLTLRVNGAIKAWPQPELTPSLFRNGYVYVVDPGHAPYQFWETDRFGFTSLMRLQRATQPVNLPGPDAALGTEWLNQSILSGPRRQLYGKDLGGWVWENDSGDVFIVGIDLNEQIAHTWTDALTITCTFSLASAIGPPSFLTPITLTLTDFGQTPPTPYLSVLDNPNQYGPGLPGEAYHKVWLTIVDISPTGRFAIVEVSGAAPEQHIVNSTTGGAYGDVWSFSGIARGVLAYLLIDLGETTTPTPATITVLKNRSQVLGPLGTPGNNLSNYYGRLHRACFNQAGEIVFFEFRAVFTGTTQLTGSWHLINMAGSSINSISLSLTLAAGEFTNSENGVFLSGQYTINAPSGQVQIQPISWSNNLVGFYSAVTGRTPLRLFHGNLLTPEGGVTLANVPYASVPQFGSYCPYVNFGLLTSRVRFAETTPVCWV